VAQTFSLCHLARHRGHVTMKLFDLIPLTFYLDDAIIY
jgi:hypothetical protein